MKIDIYTHIVPPRYKAALGRVAPHLENQINQMPTLYDLDHRFRIMDKFEDYKQVAALTATASQVFKDPKLAIDYAKMANDELAEIVARYPDRFTAGVASLPVSDMDAAVKELDRAVRELNLKGILLFTPADGKPLDLPEFLPLFEEMSDHKLPIWVHPAGARPTDDKKKYFVSHVFGWPYESTTAMTYLVLSGTFERFPGIKFVIHHCGGMVPFFAQRIAEAHSPSGAAYGMDFKGQSSRPPIDFFKMFYVDTALSGGTAGLMCGHSFFGADHILFGSDMPFDLEFGNINIGVTIRSVDEMAINDAEKKMIFEGNARKLLGL